MGALTLVGRIFIIVTNIIFFIISLVLIVVGFILRFGRSYIRNYVDQVLSELEDCVKNYYGVSTYSTDDLDIGVMLNDVAVVTIIIGAILLALSLLAFVGACCGVKIIMLIYAIAVAVIMITQIVVAVIYFEYPDVMKNAVKPTLKTYLDDYDGVQGTGYALGVNVVMQSYKCCGVNDEKDFKKSKGKWKKNDKDGDKVITPVCCCKKLPKDDTKRNQCAGNSDVSTDVTTLVDSNYSKGCVDAVFEDIEENYNIYFKVAVALCCILQAALIVFAIIVYKSKGLKGMLV